MRRGALAAVTVLVLLPGCGAGAVRPETADAWEELQGDAGTAVTVQAEVAALVSPRAFTITREAGTGGGRPLGQDGTAETLLVVPDRPVLLRTGLPVRVRVTVTGTIGTFSAAEHVGLASPARLDQYDGQPYLLASDVRTGDGSSLSVQ